jgi:serine/threonine-protein kinase
VAVDEANQGGDIWVWNFAAENGVRLTTSEASEAYPVWTQDDDRIAFAPAIVISDAAPGGISWKASSNTGSVELLTPQLGAGTEGLTPYFFAMDDQFLVFREQQHPETQDNIGMVALEAGSEPVWLLASEFHERYAELSPDGNWMAYQSDESGRFEVYVRPFPNVDDDLFTISTAGGVKPLWGPDGTELFYIAPGAPPRMMVVDVETGTGFSHQLPRELIEWPYDRFNEGGTFDIAPDGSRFLTTKPAADSSQGDAPRPVQEVRIVLNWFGEVRERVPVP